MKKTVVLIFHRTTTDRASRAAFEQLGEALAVSLEKYKEIHVVPAWFSGSGNGVGRDGSVPYLRTAVQEALAGGTEEIVFVTTLITTGEEWDRINDAVRAAMHGTDVPFSVQPPLLDPENEESPANFADAIEGAYRFERGQQYLLIGRGGTPETDREFDRLAETFKEDDLRNVHLSSMTDYDRINAIGARIRMEEGSRLVILRPLFVTSDEVDLSVSNTPGQPSLISLFESHGENIRYERNGLLQYSRFVTALVDHYKGFIL